MGGGSSLLYITIAYYMQKGGEGVQIACKDAYVINGRPHMDPILTKQLLLYSRQRVVIQLRDIHGL